MDSTHQRKASQERADPIASRDLAALIVDALVDAGIVKADDIRRAIEVATDEIDVRKALGDY